MGKGVSGHTYTQEQLDSYANQNNPNNSVRMKCFMINLEVKTFLFLLNVLE